MLTLNTWWLGLPWSVARRSPGKGKEVLFIHSAYKNPFLLVNYRRKCTLFTLCYFWGVWAHIVAQARLEFIPGQCHVVHHPPHLVYVVDSVYLFIFLDSGQQKCASCISTS